MRKQKAERRDGSAVARKLEKIDVEDDAGMRAGLMRAGRDGLGWEGRAERGRQEQEHESEMLERAQDPRESDWRREENGCETEWWVAVR